MQIAAPMTGVSAADEPLAPAGSQESRMARPAEPDLGHADGGQQVAGQM